MQDEEDLLIALSDPGFLPSQYISPGQSASGYIFKQTYIFQIIGKTRQALLVPLELLDCKIDTP